jgi:hypothetical protein
MRCTRGVSLDPDTRSRRRKRRYGVVGCFVIFSAGLLTGTPDGKSASGSDLRSLRRLKVIGGHSEVTSYKGRPAIRLSPASDHPGSDDAVMAIVPDSEFKDGTVELEVAGSPRVGADEGARGFIGIAFHVRIDVGRWELIYLRPTNGRSEDQLRRNHSVQYVQHPDFPWERLRKESPGVYESYVDLEPGEWTRMKIEVSGSRARLYVNGSKMPCLVVNDLKLGEIPGAVALWSHSSTDGYFSDLTVARKRFDPEGQRKKGEPL